MALTAANTLSNIVSQIDPAIASIAPGSGVKNAKVWQDFLTDSITLIVEHKLLSRMEMERGHWHALVAARIRKATLVDGPSSGKLIRAERRQLMLRGNSAKTLKPRVK